MTSGALRALTLFTVISGGLAGCSSSVVVAGPNADDSCDPALEPTDQLPDEVVIGNPTSGTFIDGRLHLRATVDGEEAYVVVAFADGVAWMASRPGLGYAPANWAHVHDSIYARLRADTSEQLTIDVIDAADPEQPKVIGLKPLGETVEPAWQPVYSAADDYLFFCIRAAGETRSLMKVDLHDPANPGDPSPVLNNLCDGHSRHSGSAKGRIWMVWGEQHDLEVHAVSPNGTLQLGDYYYNPDGIHSYGKVLAASTDGSRVVADPANDSEFFLFELTTGPAQFEHAYWGLSGPKRLLGVLDEVAYLATSDGVRGYDVGNLSDPVLTDTFATIDFGESLAWLVAGDDEHLAIASGGKLYVMRRDHNGDIDPITMYASQPQTATRPCSDVPR